MVDISLFTFSLTTEQVLGYIMFICTASLWHTRWALLLVLFQNYLSFEYKYSIFLMTYTVQSNKLSLKWGKIFVHHFVSNVKFGHPQSANQKPPWNMRLWPSKINQSHISIPLWGFGPSTSPTKMLINIGLGQKYHTSARIVISNVK